ncbi:hypothetical protein EDI_049390 [Entamoeba dispar SAW760]|uniref:Uncharacterized protein n=1 Tax=Entamoeba dispar (strain ATCC PRA-260 / SAW760) TaxID=370354 RepID=B0EFE9_ENTDS|nr:uncharacterized protein EDI_049390 [Entamoeba dispar SAW760]EDR26728.1 hypothetical protein EDI_049390 [Entamoeba dispar SAW760]|eukprot:EDR26728.1 hypothetical protein EDI_049390 [Entamoeba dispar SAW760]
MIEGFLDTEFIKIIRIGFVHKTKYVVQILMKNKLIEWVESSLITDFNTILLRMNDLKLTGQYLVEPPILPIHNIKKQIPKEVSLRQSPLLSLIDRIPNPSLKNSCKNTLYKSCTNGFLSLKKSSSTIKSGIPSGGFAPSAPSISASLPNLLTISSDKQKLKLPVQPLNINGSAHPLISSFIQKPLTGSLPSLFEQNTNCKSIKSSLQFSSSQTTVTKELLDQAFIMGFNLNEISSSPDILHSFIGLIGNEFIPIPSSQCSKEEMETVLNQVKRIIDKKYNGRTDELMNALKFGRIYKKVMNLWDLKYKLIDWKSYFIITINELQSEAFKISKILTEEFSSLLLKFTNWEQWENYNFMSDFNQITSYFNI